MSIPGHKPGLTVRHLMVLCFFLVRFYWLKVRSLAESRNWLELDRFSKARKSLIGYEVNFSFSFTI